MMGTCGFMFVGLFRMPIKHAAIPQKPQKKTKRYQSINKKKELFSICKINTNHKKSTKNPEYKRKVYNNVYY